MRRATRQRIQVTFGSSLMIHRRSLSDGAHHQFKLLVLLKILSCPGSLMIEINSVTGSDTVSSFCGLLETVWPNEAT